MATLRKRGKRWHVQVRRKGRPSVTRSFLLRSDALALAHAKELEADRQGIPTSHKGLRAISVADIVTRYRDEVVPRKRGADRETLVLNVFLRHPLAQVALSDVTTGMVSAYCAERLLRVKPGTINRELDILRHAFAVAHRSWDVPLTSNIFAEVTRPKNANPRERRLHSGEEERLLFACGRCRNPYVRFLVQLALETAMRRGGLLKMRWCDVSVEKRTLHIPVTRMVTREPFRSQLRTLSDSRTSGSERILPITENAAKMAWKRLAKRARLVNLRFFERGLSVPEVALISGHRDPRMLFRYTHPRAEDIAVKLQ